MAGLATTTLVGLAGASSSWLIAREDRDSQRSLAHDARVYDRRANAYVDALRYLQSFAASVQRVTLTLANERTLELPRPSRDPNLRATLSAYASSAALEAFDRTVNSGRKALDLSQGVDSAPESEREARFNSYLDVRDRFRHELATFRRIVRSEIG